MFSFCCCYQVVTVLVSCMHFIHKCVCVCVCVCVCWDAEVEHKRFFFMQFFKLSAEFLHSVNHFIWTASYSLFLLPLEIPLPSFPTYVQGYLI